MKTKYVFNFFLWENGDIGITWHKDFEQARELGDPAEKIELNQIEITKSSLGAIESLIISLKENDGHIVKINDYRKKV